MHHVGLPIYVVKDTTIKELKIISVFTDRFIAEDNIRNRELFRMEDNYVAYYTSRSYAVYQVAHNSLMETYGLSKSTIQLMRDSVLNRNRSADMIAPLTVIAEALNNEGAIHITPEMVQQVMSDKNSDFYRKRYSSDIVATV